VSTLNQIVGVGTDYVVYFGFIGLMLVHSVH